MSVPGQNPATGVPGQNPATGVPGQNPAADAPGQNPATDAPGHNPATGVPGQNPATGAPGQNPATGAPGQDPTSVVWSPQVDYGVEEATIEEGIVAAKRVNGFAAVPHNDVQPYLRVKNMLWIRRNSVYSVALEEWEREAKHFADRVEKMDKRSGDLKNETYQLVGFFSVFQGVVLTAVAQLTQSDDENKICKKVWSPVVLTILAWVVASVGVWKKLSNIEGIEKLRSEDDDTRREAAQRANDLRDKGPSFDFTRIRMKATRPVPIECLGHGFMRFWLNRFGPVFASLSVFTAIFVASYFLILCDRGLR